MFVEGRTSNEVSEKNEKVCFTIVDGVECMPECFATKYRSAVIYGEISTVTEHGEKKLGLIRKYSPAYLEKGMHYIEKSLEEVRGLKLHIKQATGKTKR